MRIVLERVSRASVSIDGRVVGEIGRGYLILAGFAPGDSDEQLSWMGEKIHGLRLFADDEGKMNLALDDVHGGVLVVPQFTLYGDARKGRRPSFIGAAPPEEAAVLYGRFVTLLADRGLEVATGTFGAMMAVDLVNEGPVTLILER